MKKLTLAAVLFVFAVLMVLPIIGSVNLSAGKLALTAPALTADGWPMPPYPPSGGNSEILTADGWPMPPYPPSGLLVADGWPMPPYPPNGGSSTLTVA